ncbi:MAG: PIG-L deacetylase family protein [Calditrichia bacterium]
MKIMAIFAHPDDETFGPAGTLSRYARQGHEIFLLTMTRGEAGSLGISKELGKKELARRRTEELKCAAEKLGIRKLEIGNFPDKQLPDLPEGVGPEFIRQKIAGFNPEIVITFHPNGISGHSDHQTVSGWTLQVVKTHFPHLRLFYYGITRKQRDQFPERELQPMKDAEITHRIGVKEYLQFKEQAANCHQTQIELWKMFEALPQGWQSFSGFEHFSQAWPLPGSADVKGELI